MVSILGCCEISDLGKAYRFLEPNSWNQTEIKQEKYLGRPVAMFPKWENWSSERGQEQPQYHIKFSLSLPSPVSFFFLSSNKTVRILSTISFCVFRFLCLCSSSLPTYRQLGSQWGLPRP